MTDIAADVIVVGSGIAGALVAARLAADGIGVAILEAGARVDRGDALGNFEAAAVKVPECPYPATPDAEHPVTDDLHHWYRQQGPQLFASTYLKVVGGTTWHWLGTCLRLLPSDFALRSRYGRGVDWPIAYETLESFYGEAEHEIGVSGDGAETLGSPRSSAYPMPAIPQSYLDKAFAKALAGSVYEVRSTPQGRNAVERDGRPACCGSANCIPLCPIHAKYDATVHLERAEASGAALHASTTATVVELDDDRNVAAIRFKRPDGSDGKAVGKVYVIAANAIETPRLLLNSVSELSPGGVANGSGQVGRNLMDHPTQLSWALTDAPVWPYRGPLATSGIENLRDGAFRGSRAAMRIEIGNDGWSWPTGAPASTATELAAQGLRGMSLAATLRDQASRHVRLASLVEQLPDPDCRVSLDPTERDMYGVPLPRIDYRIDDYTREGLAAARNAHDEIFGKLGTSKVSHAPDVQGAGHIMGTGRMGSDTASSVVDGDLRSHEHANLFLAGASVFPTTGTANPTLTIAALSVRLAARVKQALAA